jgi:hypothetical protein
MAHSRIHFLQQMCKPAGPDERPPARSHGHALLGVEALRGEAERMVLAVLENRQSWSGSFSNGCMPAY